MSTSIHGNIDCPVCHVKISWNPQPNTFRCKCLTCGMGFIYKIIY